MEAVLPYLCSLIILIRYRVHLCLIGHRAVESRVEYYHVGAVDYRHTGFETRKTCRIVQRRKVRYLFKLFESVFVDVGRLSELLARMHYPVTYRRYLAGRRYAAVLRISKAFHYEIERVSMVGKRSFDYVCFAVYLVGIL